METHSDSELSISNLPPRPRRKAVPPDTYTAAYQGLKVFMDDTQWGPKKNVKLAFKIAGGPYDGVVVYFKGSMFKLDSGDYIIGDKSQLAEQIMVITGGDKTIGEKHKGKPVLVSVKNREGKKPEEDGTLPVFDYVDKVMKMPAGLGLPAQAAVKPAAQASAAKPAASAQAPGAAAPAAKSNGDLLDDLTDLSDFEDAGA